MPSVTHWVWWNPARKMWAVKTNKQISYVADLPLFVGYRIKGETVHGGYQPPIHGEGSPSAWVVIYPEGGVHG